MSTKKDLQIELLKLEEEIELLTLEKNEEIKEIKNKIKSTKAKIEKLEFVETKKSPKIEKLSLEKTQKINKIEKLSLEKTRKIPKKELEILSLEKTKELSLLKLENTKKFTKNEIKYLELEMTQKVEQKKLEQELNINKEKLDSKIDKLVKDNKIEEKIVNTIHNSQKNDKNKNRKKLLIKIFYIVIMISSIIILFLIAKTLLDRRTNDKEIKTQISEIINNTEITLDDSDSKKETEEESDYFKYMNTPLISVDFAELKKKNPNTKGWIQVSGTNVNYPFVQANDNEYYLSHSFDNSYNTMGWVYMDYRNNMENKDKNTILYAHGLYNNTMFGSLKQVVEANWYTNPENHVIRISTEQENSLWQIFSTYTIKPESFYLTTEFEDDKSYEAFLITMKGRSVYDYKTNVSTNDKILTLSSCYDDNVRVVVHAKLIKTTTRS